jgi:hypothetical protein
MLRLLDLPGGGLFAKTHYEVRGITAPQQPLF